MKSKKIDSKSIPWLSLFVKRPGTSFAYEGYDIPSNVKNLLLVGNKDIPNLFKKDIVQMEIDIFSEIGKYLLDEAKTMASNLSPQFMRYRGSFLEIATKLNHLYEDDLKIIKHYLANYQKISECFAAPIFSTIYYNIDANNNLTVKIVN